MKITIVQATRTPHTLARLTRAQSRAHESGHDLRALTVAGRQSDYAWPSSDAVAFEMELFSLRDYWGLGYRELRKALLQALTALDPDVVFVPGWAFKESWVTLGWAVRRHRASVLVSDSQPSEARWGPARAIVRSVVSGAVDGALVAGTPHRDYMAALGVPADRILLGCDVVDNAHFATAATRRRQAGYRLLSVVRLLPRKNLWSVLAALASADRRWNWTVAGDGPERPNLERAAAELGIEDRVRFLGNIGYQDLPDVYAEADVFIHPSLSEPWGLAVNEAMAAGLPVLVSARCGCATDLVGTSANGSIFEPSVEGIREALAHAIDRQGDWVAMGARSREVISHWGLDLYADNVMRCAQAVIEAPRRRANKLLRML